MLAANIQIELLHEDTKVPEIKTIGSAGADLYAYLKKEEEIVIIQPGETKLIPLGFKTSFSSDFVGLIYARSGLATKHGLAPANKVGVIDSDYRGEWMVALHNHSNEPQVINHNDRIAQVVFQPVADPIFHIISKVDETARGEGGFGSTENK